MRLKKYMMGVLVSAVCILGCACAQPGTAEPTPTPTQEPTMTPTPIVYYSLIKVDETKTHQTWESFGVSGAWWAQYVGGWDQPYKDHELSTREEIVQYLYSMENGIGLTSYRYNLGAGSVEKEDSGNFWYSERRAECFEISAGVYDFENKDVNAQWMLKRIVEVTEGEVDIVLFANSPLCRLTTNGKAMMTSGSTNNLPEENYDDFAKYMFDVAEYFISQGIPVTDISPINEPQWEWADGQEGCHYEPQQCADLLRVFVDEIQNRDTLLNAGVKVSAPESGCWGGDTQKYIKAIMGDDVLRDYFDVIDCHSYWSDLADKKSFKNWMKRYYPDVELRMSEWCEMVNGSDYTMDSAFNMADVIMQDITELDVTAWQYWVGVANGGYRDGLIYVSTSAKACRPAKRLWVMGNFSKFIRPGFVRVDVSQPYKDIYNLSTVAFTGVQDGKEELVIVVSNKEEEKTVQMGLADFSKYVSYEVYTTNENRDLEMTQSGTFEEYTPITIEAESVVTIRLISK